MTPTATPTHVDVSHGTQTAIEVVDDRTGARRIFHSPKPRWRIIEGLDFAVYALNKKPHPIACCLCAFADGRLVFHVDAGRNAFRRVVGEVLKQGGLYA